jgi:hypothetical protein
MASKPNEIGVDILQFRIQMQDEMKEQLADAAKHLQGFVTLATKSARAATSATSAIGRGVGAVGRGLGSIPGMKALGKGGKGVFDFFNKPISELSPVGIATRVGAANAARGLLQDVLETDRLIYDAIKIGFTPNEAHKAILNAIDQSIGPQLDGLNATTKDLYLNMDKLTATTFKLATTGVGTLAKSSKEALEQSSQLATSIALIDRNYKGNSETLTEFALQMHILGVDVDKNRDLMLGAAKAANVMKRDYDVLIAPISGMTDFLRSIDQHARSGAVRQLIQTGGLITAVMGDPTEVKTIFERLRRLDTDQGLKAFLGRGGQDVAHIENMVKSGDIKGLITAMVQSAGKIGTGAGGTDLWKRLPDEMAKAFDMAPETFFMLREASKNLDVLGKLGGAFGGGFDIKGLLERQAALSDTLTGSLVKLKSLLAPILRELAIGLGGVLKFLAKGIVGFVEFFAHPAAVIARGVREGFTAVVNTMKGLVTAGKMLWNQFGGSATGHLVTSSSIRRVAETSPELILPLERVAPFLRSMGGNVGGGDSNAALTEVMSMMYSELNRIRMFLEQQRNDPFGRSHGGAY